MEISPAHHAAFIGPNGSGKSYLALGYVASVTSVIVHDPKREITLPGFPILENPADLYRYPRVIWRPPALSDPLTTADAAASAAIRRGHTLLYLDEAALAAPGQRIGAWLREAFLAGRSRGVAIWGATQRPKDVHNMIFSEAWAFFIAPTLAGFDRAKVRGFVGEDFEPLCQKLWPPYTFLAYTRGQPAGTPIRAPA